MVESDDVLPPPLIDSFVRGGDEGISILRSSSCPFVVVVEELSKKICLKVNRNLKRKVELVVNLELQIPGRQKKSAISLLLLLLLQPSSYAPC